MNACENRTMRHCCQKTWAHTALDGQCRNLNIHQIQQDITYYGLQMFQSFGTGPGVCSLPSKAEGQSQWCVRLYLQTHNLQYDHVVRGTHIHSTMVGFPE